MNNIKVIYLIIIDILKDCFNWIIKHLPGRKHLCFIFGHRYKGVWLKDTINLDASIGEGVMVADTEKHGCIYCGHKHKNKWPENQIDWGRSE